MALDAFEVLTYSNRIGMAAQQLNSKLAQTTSKEPIAGVQRRWRAYAALEMEKIIGRAAQTNWRDMSRLQRTIMRERWGLPILLDPDSDEIDLQQFFEPNTAFYDTLMSAGSRGYDRSIIAAYAATAKGGDDGTTDQPFPAAQEIAHGSANLTISKIAQAMQLLDEADWPDEGRFLVAHPREIRGLLLDNTASGTGSLPAVSTIDTNEVKALVEGRISYFMRFTVIRSSLIVNHISTDRYAYAVHNKAMVSGVQDRAEIKVGEIPERNFARGIGAYLFTAATRVFDNGVVRINNLIA
jgi:hypothetical protein